ncbi:MAG: hypothetical protein IAG10_26075 [Planctomycetaceae bacterium]|nr:hypothetical protein [Planctomycetaceae bacterium]
MSRIVFVMCLLAIGCSQGLKHKKEVVIDDRERFPTSCALHNVPLMDSLDPVEASHISWDGIYLGTRAREFPLAMNHLTRYDADKVWIRHCPECRRVEAEWEERWQSEQETPSE